MKSSALYNLAEIFDAISALKSIPAEGCRVFSVIPQRLQPGRLAVEQQGSE
jgi:hypothetical protein